MLFYAGRIIEHPAMENPTLVFLTDRNDLDDQLFGQFQRCHELVRQTPVQAESVEHLRKLLNVASGGVVFTTIQKFMPEEKGGKAPLLSNRRNIVVIADEAHRSQYDLIDGLARNLRDSLPSASFIGFTGTPIEKTDANTRAVFGDYISIYDIQRAVADKATVPIYYESRVAKLGLNQAELPKIDEEFEEITEGEELTRKEKLKTKWAALEALVGNPKRIDLIAADLVQHYERRLEAMEGKAMIVCMSRRICVELYNAIIKLRPEWASGPKRRRHRQVMRREDRHDRQRRRWPRLAATHPQQEKRRALAAHFKAPNDPFKIVIVRDMWLTGFDAPVLSTMYVDKPMRGHGLMQAIARVNRVFRDKPGGLGRRLPRPGRSAEAGAGDLHAKRRQRQSRASTPRQPSLPCWRNTTIACGMMHGFDWSKWCDGTPAQKMSLLPPAQEHILQQEKGKERFVQIVTELSQAFALCAGSEDALEIRDDIGFFQAVKAALAKPRGERKSSESLDHAVRQLVAKAIVPEGEIIDVFSAAGLKQPDISILSDQFLAEVRGLKYKNVAAELLAKLLGDEIKVRSKRNLVQSREFSEMLKKTLTQRLCALSVIGYWQYAKNPRTTAPSKRWATPKAFASRRRAKGHRRRVSHPSPQKRHHRLDRSAKAPAPRSKS